MMHLILSEKKIKKEQKTRSQINFEIHLFIVIFLERQRGVCIVFYPPQKLLWPNFK